MSYSKDIDELNNLGGYVADIGNYTYQREFFRLKVPGGWLVYCDLIVTDNRSDKVEQIKSQVNFISDLKHEWNIK